MFDFEKFDSASFTFPTKKIPVPDLKEFFAEGQEAVWEIRGLTGIQIFSADETNENFQRFKAAFESIASDVVDKMKVGFDELLNRGKDPVPETYMKWLKYLQYGSVPECPEHICVKLAHTKPVVFKYLISEIIKLTGLGAELGK